MRYEECPSIRGRVSDLKPAIQELNCFDAEGQKVLRSLRTKYPEDYCSASEISDGFISMTLQTTFYHARGHHSVPLLDVLVNDALHLLDLITPGSLIRGWDYILDRDQILFFSPSNGIFTTRPCLDIGNDLVPN